MNPPQVYMSSPSWTLLPPPSPFHPSESSQCTSPKHPVSCIEPGLATRFQERFIEENTPSFPPWGWGSGEDTKLYYLVSSASTLWYIQEITKNVQTPPFANPVNLGHTKKKIFIVYLKFKFNWASFISFGSLIHSRCTSHVEIKTVKIYCFSLTFSTQTKNCQISTSTEHHAKPYSTPQVLWIPFTLFCALFCHSVSIQLDFVHFCIFIY